MPSPSNLSGSHEGRRLDVSAFQGVAEEEEVADGRDAERQEPMTIAEERREGGRRLGEKWTRTNGG